MTTSRMFMTGPWRAVISSTDRLAGGGFGRAVDDAIKAEAMRMMKLVGQAFKNQGLLRPWIRLSPVTLAIRRKSGFGGSRILQVTNSLRRSVQMRKGAGGRGYFVGVHRMARGPKGKPMINIAAVHEGPNPTLVPVTEKLRKFWMAMFLQGKVKAPLRRNRKVLVIWPRPFLKPAFERVKKGSARRMVKRVERYLKAHGLKK
jgi:hypothetical protein